MESGNVAITGLPGSGKTTLIRKLAAHMMSWRPVGFYTVELREAGVRTGFDLVSLEGRRRTLAHVRFPHRERVGKYGVDVAGFEDFLGDLALEDRGTGLIVIDEIGRMECLSERFVTLTGALLDSEAVVLATVALRGRGLIGEVKKRPDTVLFEVHPGNREVIGSDIIERVLGLLNAGQESGTI